MMFSTAPTGLMGTGITYGDARKKAVEKKLVANEGAGCILFGLGRQMEILVSYGEWRHGRSDSGS